MSVDISVSITEDVVDIIATPTVNIVNVTNSASIDPGLYDLSEFTNTSPNPFVRASGLSSYVPTSRTLTINGVTQDLSANRTFTISTGITIGSTAIASGVVGRVLFEGAGNVVQESSSLFWDATNNRLGIGTSSPTQTLEVNGLSVFRDAMLFSLAGDRGLLTWGGGYFQLRSQATNGLILGLASSEAIRIPTTGNVLIGTTTDAGFMLDVNGVSRIRTFQSGTPTILNIHNQETNGLPGGAIAFYTGGSSSLASRIVSQRTGPIGESDIALETTGVKRLFVAATSGNVLINTTTDNGFKLDVNGTARVQGNAQFGTGFYWDNTNNRLGIGVSSPARRIDISGSGDVLTGLKTTSATGAAAHVVLNDVNSSFEFGMWGSTRSSYGAIFPNNAYIYGGVDFAITSTSNIKFGAGAPPNERMRIVGGTGNVLINTTTDAGFRLDVNGTARATSFTASTFGSSFNIGGVNVVDFGDGLRIGYSASVSKISLFTNGATQGLQVNSGSVSIGPQLTPNASAILDLTSTTKGFLPPRMTTTQINAIASPAEGLMVYNTTISHMCVYQAGSWVKLSHSPM